MRTLTNTALRATAYLLLHVGLLCTAVVTQFDVDLRIGIALTTIAATIFAVTRSFLPSEIAAIVGLTQACGCVGVLCSSSHGVLTAQGMTQIAIVSAGAGVAAFAGVMLGVRLLRN